MTSRNDVRGVPRSHASSAVIKSTEFLESAQSSLGAARWNSAGLSAIHSGIASADAALIAGAGLRSISKDHGAVVGLLEAEVKDFGAAQRRQLTGLLKMKNQVAYDQRLLTDVEARQLVDNASRLNKWARRIVTDEIGE